MAKAKTPRQILSTHLSRALAYEAVNKLTEARAAGEELVKSMIRYGLLDPSCCPKLGHSSNVKSEK